MRNACKIDTCGGYVKGYGLCEKHYQRARKAGTLPRRKTEWERFWEKVEIGDCWTWQASLVGGGYGWFGRTRQAKGSRLAHRWAWETLVGPVPDGLDLDHLCRNRACVNPDHLEPVTRQVNLLRGATQTAAAAARTHCPQGHEYTEDNLYRTKEGHRLCRRCRCDKSRADYHRRKQQEAA